jgi:hypothetical protein
MHVGYSSVMVLSLRSFGVGFRAWYHNHSNLGSKIITIEDAIAHSHTVAQGRDSNILAGHSMTLFRADQGLASRWHLKSVCDHSRALAYLTIASITTDGGVTAYLECSTPSRHLR